MEWATVRDLLDRWPDLVDVPDATLSARLDDANATVAAELEGAGVSPEATPSDVLAANLKSVVCDVAHRALFAYVSGMVGVTQFSQTAGPVQQSQSFGNPMGDMYLTASDRRKLGISGGRGQQVFYGADVLGGGDA